MAERREKGWKEGRRSCFLVRPQGGHLSLMVHKRKREGGRREKESGGGGGGGGDTDTDKQR